MLKRARCPSCGTCLPLGPKIHKFSIPPRMVMCPKCATVIHTTFAYRATWLQSVLWKAIAILALGVGVVSLFVTEKDLPPVMFLFVPLTMFFFGGLAGFLVATLAAPPLQVVVEAVAWTVRKVTGANGTNHQDSTPA
ncbi:MAG: hypothetical protein JXB04_11685 [Kiritimatiellae bacterium]|nr:hypothetical protein [Kiritimatiellia bacterium]